MKSGIYIITNLKNSKKYIGSASDIKKRWRDHKWHLKNKIHHNPHLQAAYNKYGLNNFKFEILTHCNLNELNDVEKFYINEYDTKNPIHGYNINDPRTILYHNGRKKIIKNVKKFFGDENPMYNKLGENHPKFGYKLSKESKNKISEKMKLRKGSESNNSKLTEKDVLKIRDYYSNKKISQTELSKIFNVNQATISSIVRYKTWTHI